MMPIKGSISFPGDKSISHRSLMIGSLTEKNCVINNISTAIDVESTRNCLKMCGIQSKKKGNTVFLNGGAYTNPNNPLFCGNSGTTVRLLIGLLAGKGITAEFHGDKSLSKRPMKRIIEPLSQMGVKIESENGYLPIKIFPSFLQGITYLSVIPSAQVKSSIIFAAFGANGETIIKEHAKSRDHTEIMLKSLGVQLNNGENISIKPLLKPLNSFELTVPGDPSSAAFFAAAAAMIPNSHLKINSLLANPTRIGFFNVLKEMGTHVTWHNIRNEGGECVGDVDINYNPLNGIHIKEAIIPSVIDEIPIISLLATQADSPTIIEGASELRVKESDRIRGICINLQLMGADVIEKKDGFIVNPINSLHHAKIRTFNDHRIAMAFTIGGLITQKRNILDNEDCINISFPEFNTILEKILQ